MPRKRKSREIGKHVYRVILPDGKEVDIYEEYKGVFLMVPRYAPWMNKRREPRIIEIRDEERIDKKSEGGYELVPDEEG